MIELINVYKEYGKDDNKQIALNNINLRIKSRGFVVIYGDSGSGKTTLLNCIAKIDKPTSGEIKGISKGDVSFIFQDYALFDNMSIEANIDLSKSSSDLLTIDDALESVHLKESKKKRINELSGGQKQRVAISKALISNRNVIIADEPTGNLDSSNSIAIAEELKNVSSDKLVIVVTHNKELFEKYADRLIEIKDGTITSDVTINELADVDKKSENMLPKLGFKSVFSLFKASTKLSISKIVFGVLILFLAMFSISIWLNFINVSRYSLLKNSINKTNIPVIGFSKANHWYINDEDYEQVGESFDNYVTIYNYSHGGMTITLDENNYDINYVYETSVCKSDLLYGNNYFKDDEIIISYSLAKSISSKYNNDISSLIGKTVSLGEKEIKIVGIDEKTNDIPKKSGYEDANEMYQLEKNYCYMNKNTYKSIIMSNDYLLFDTSYCLDNIIYLDSSIDDFVLDNGTDILGKNDIILSSQDYKKLCCTELDKEELINKVYRFTFNYYGGITKEYTLKIVGFGNYTIVNSETFNCLYDYSSFVHEALQISKIGFFSNDISKKTLSKMDNMGYSLDYFLADSVETTKSWIKNISIIITIFSIPMVLIMFLYMISFAKQNINSKRREIGILKSMSYSNKQISKIFIIETILLIVISLLLTIIFIPIGVLIINDVFYGSFAYYKVIDNNYLYIIVLILLMIVTFVFTIAMNLHKLNKKEDVDLIYGR